MTADRERWDAHYSGPQGAERRAPDAAVLSLLEQVGSARGRRALDLASGTGRHALELARRGWETSAWDVSPVGLAELARRARADGFAVGTRAVDLVSAPPPCETFDLVVVVDFLDRPLLRGLHAFLAPGGHALVATFTAEWPGERPSARFRLQRGELAAGLPGLETVTSLEEGGRAALLARRPPA